jgi:hypothetical protein
VSKARGQQLGWTNEMIESDDNLQTICHDTHKIKTAKETGRTLIVKTKIGEDGFPV